MHGSDREPVLVTLDVGSLGNNDVNSIENVIKDVLLSGSLGNYRLSTEGFSIRSFSKYKIPLYSKLEFVSVNWLLQYMEVAFLRLVQKVNFVFSLMSILLHSCIKWKLVYLSLTFDMHKKLITDAMLLK